MGWVQLAVLVSHCHQGASIQCKLNCLFDNLFRRKQRKDQSSARNTGPVQAESTVAYRKQKPAIRKAFTCPGDFIKKASCGKIQINHRSVYQYMSDWSEPKTQHMDSSILGGVASGHLPRFIHVSSLIKSLIKGCMFVLRGMPYYEMNLERLSRPFLCAGYTYTNLHITQIARYDCQHQPKAWKHNACLLSLSTLRCRIIFSEKSTFGRFFNNRSAICRLSFVENLSPIGNVYIATNAVQLKFEIFTQHL